MSEGVCQRYLSNHREAELLKRYGWWKKSHEIEYATFYIIYLTYDDIKIMILGKYSQVENINLIIIIWNFWI